jgi:L-fucose isomerase-like protein
MSVNTEEQAHQAAATDADALLVYAASGDTPWFHILAASRAPNIMFIRHKSGAYYLWHEIAHWRLLRGNEDAMVEPNMDVWDIVVDEYDDLTWRLRALYGLKNARGTKMLAIGSLAAYSAPGQELGPKHAREVWGYEIEIVPHDEFRQRLSRARADASVMRVVEQEVAAFLKRPRLKLETERRFVTNSFVALHVCRELLREKNAFNFGFDHCMGGDVIEMLDTPPCLVSALANDEGYTAYCHTDLTHTVPGVLLRWIAGRPTFVCNTHLPHHGVFTVAHCAAPMKMNGRDPEPTTVMTHYESDYGAATKVEYPKGQEVTVVVPALNCTRWHGFKGTVIASPALPACRSQMDIRIAGNWKELAENMEGFHAQVVYGDYLREVGYALKKVKAVQWKNYSENA